MTIGIIIIAIITIAIISTISPGLDRHTYDQNLLEVGSRFRREI